MLLTLKCPKCGNTQNYRPNPPGSLIINNKRKTCVYCARTFIARTHIIKRLE